MLQDIIYYSSLCNNNFIVVCHNMKNKDKCIEFRSNFHAIIIFSYTKGPNMQGQK